MANVICTLLRDEDNLVADFVLHHLAIGFDRIVMFDDQSAVPVQDLIAGLPEQIRTKVECHRLTSDFYGWAAEPDHAYFSEHLFARFRSSKQMYFANLALERFVEPTDWVAFTDVDEFIWLGTHGSIEHFRDELQRRGRAGVIFPMLLYGHGFHAVPPQDNNICAFLWRAVHMWGHGKFFAQVGSVQVIQDIHFPTLHSPRLMCDTLLKERNQALDEGQSKITDTNVPHLKHYIVQDVFTCFRRRIRNRISQRPPVSPDSATWTDRIDMLRWTSAVMDCEMAASLILTRVRLGMEVPGHARALSIALERAPLAEGIGRTIDFQHLREHMRAEHSESDAHVLHRYFLQAEPDRSALRFPSLPVDFDAYEYRSLYRDLTSVDMTKQQLEAHYLTYGRNEGRKYRRV